VPPEPVFPTDRILYTVVGGGTQPTSTWITTNCSENVFNAETGEGYLVLNEGVDTVEGQEVGKQVYTIFDDGTGNDVATVVLPSQITSIGDSAFRGCTGLTSVTIPSSVTSIGNYAFRGCTGLTSVTIPSSITSIGDSAFRGCTGLTSVTIPSSITSIGNFVFSECTGLTSVTIPSSVTRIGNGAFAGCTGLTTVTIPSSVTSIGDFAFRGCTGLTSVTIPSSVTSIGNYAFRGCTSLASVACFATTPPTLGADVFEGINTTTCAVPSPSISAYTSNASWSAVFSTFTAIPGTEDTSGDK